MMTAKEFDKFMPPASVVHDGIVARFGEIGRKLGELYRERQLAAVLRAINATGREGESYCLGCVDPDTVVPE